MNFPTMFPELEKIKFPDYTFTPEWNIPKWMIDEVNAHDPLIKTKKGWAIKAPMADPSTIKLTNSERYLKVSYKISKDFQDDDNTYVILIDSFKIPFDMIQEVVYESGTMFFVMKEKDQKEIPIVVK